jgi:hypothetical protein
VKAEYTSKVSRAQEDENDERYSAGSVAAQFKNLSFASKS